MGRDCLAETVQWSNETAIERAGGYIYNSSLLAQGIIVASSGIPLSGVVLVVMRTKIVVLAMVVIAVTATLGVSAYTTGSVTRDSNVNVVTDDKGLIALSDGTSGGLVAQNSTGALNVDFTAGGASGVNTAAHFELGNPSDPTNYSAFNISNLDAESHDLTVSYTGAGGTTDTDANMEFQIYDSAGTKVGTVSEESTSATITGASSGATYYVVIVVDTTGLDSTADLSGTLEVSA